jgi:hypothetical protein
MLISQQRMTGTVANQEVDAVKAPVKLRSFSYQKTLNRKDCKVKYVFD